MTIQLALPFVVGAFDWTSQWTIVGLPVTAALAAIALIGYLFGHRTRSKLAELDGRRQRELDRAARIAWQLENIASTLRQDLVTHHTQVAAFKRRVRHAHETGDEELWETLCTEAEAILGPTMQLAHQLSHAYDQIRQQSDALETFTQGRTDPLTGVGNGRALEQQLQVLFAGAARGNAEFAVALISLDRNSNKSDSAGLTPIMSQLPKLAGVIRQCLRGDTDFVARFGDEEFIILMPQTSLAGASVFGDRLRTRVVEELGTTVSCGIAIAENSDDAKSLLARADSALYSAKAAGPNQMFLHTGTHIREHRSDLFQIASGQQSGLSPASDRDDSANEGEPYGAGNELVLQNGR
ncbi:MAG: GGDEF domain-containing protein [Pirellulales bacterium]